MFRRVAVLFGVLGGALMLHGQATPTASRPGDALLGAGYTRGASDYGLNITGYNFYGDFDFTRHIGVEAEFHNATARAPSPIYERTYEIGARYFRNYGIFVPYGKVLVGRGVFNYPSCIIGSPSTPCANLAYNMYALGFGTDVKVRRWLYVRADFEYQSWPGFKGTITGDANGLSPSLFSVGAAYHFR